MVSDDDIHVQFFFPFPDQAIPDPFAKLKAATGKFGELKIRYPLIADQDFPVLIDPNAINPDSKTLHPVNVQFFQSWKNAHPFRSLKELPAEHFSQFPFDDQVRHGL